MLLARRQIGFPGNERSMGTAVSGILYVLLNIPIVDMVDPRRKHAYCSNYAVCTTVILHNVRAIVR